ncbi:MAG TPA: VIT family protein [Alphaproteobacteria bacterium]|nr:VIT family protein [Alphaproteobacteria bacterium]
MKKRPAPKKHPVHEPHLLHRIGWVRAAVLGANDGIISTASLLSGVAAGGASHDIIILSGLAGLVGGALSMATGEYISVSSQADIEEADLNREKIELAQHPEFEREELTQIYVKRGLKPDLAREVAKQLMEKDALGAHARDELGLTKIAKARPLQAALASAASFTLGASLPLGVAWFAPAAQEGWFVTGASLASLVLLGAISAHLAQVSFMRPVLRTLFWGALSMGATALIGHLFGVPTGG